MNRNQPEALELTSSTGVARPLVLKFGGSLVEQLGAQLYPSVTATVAELISNAWDADAENVWVTVPFGEKWNSNAELIVLDDGHGMTRVQAQEAYLIVGRKKRLSALGDRSEGGRLVHGRKGIGKLAAFGTAGYLECTSLRDGTITAFGIDYDEVRLLNPDQDYFVDDIDQPETLTAPDGTRLNHGTRVRLKSLRVKRRISAESFQISMSRRFALRGMNVFINGEALQRFQIPLQFRLPADYAPDGVTVDIDGWGSEILPSGDVVRWWIGFTEKPLSEGDQQGVSVLARDKMAQRPFKFERSQGTTAQLGLEYLVGEVEANWLDQGDDIESDYIQSNRDQLQLENARLDEFMDWGRKRLTWALRARAELKAKLAVSLAAENDELDEIIGVATARERRALLGVANKLARLPEVDRSGINSIMRSVMDSRSDSQVRELMEELREQEDPKQEHLWNLVSQFGAIDARRVVAIINARIATIKKIQEALSSGIAIPDVSSLVRQDVWLLDPRWHLLAEVDDPDTALELRFSSFASEAVRADTFVLCPGAPASMDELVVVMTKGMDATQSVEATTDEMAAFQRFVGGIAEQLNDRPNAPAVRGLMVARSFSSPSLEPKTGTHSRVNFRTWEAVMDETLRMHKGWLSVSESRSAIDPTS